MAFLCKGPHWNLRVALAHEKTQAKAIMRAKDLMRKVIKGDYIGLLIELLKGKEVFNLKGKPLFYEDLNAFFMKRGCWDWKGRIKII